jgi:hypothetical protein
MLFVLQNTADDSMAKFIAKNIATPVSVLSNKRFVEVEIDDDEAEDFEDAIEHAGHVILDRQKTTTVDKKKQGEERGQGKSDGQGFAKAKAESSIRRSPYESPWRHPRDPWE